MTDPVATSRILTLVFTDLADSTAPRTQRGDQEFDVQSLMCPDVAMKQVKIADLKNQLSQHLRAVERGAEIEVTDRNRPIVRLVPVRAAESQIRIIPAKRPFAEVRNKRYPKARWGAGSLKVLLEERGKR